MSYDATSWLAKRRLRAYKVYVNVNGNDGNAGMDSTLVWQVQAYLTARHCNCVFAPVKCGVRFLPRYLPGTPDVAAR